MNFIAYALRFQICFVFPLERNINDLNITDLEPLIILFCEFRRVFYWILMPATASQTVLSM